MNIIKEEEYYGLKRLSYSMISGFDREGPEYLVKSQKDNKSMNLGSVVDDILTNPSQFRQMYHVSKYKEPTA